MNDRFQQDMQKNMLFNPDESRDSCGVGFITHKQSLQTHDLLLKTHEALCTIPHRGGMSAEGIGDGAGVNIDLSIRFFRKLTGQENLAPGSFGVANFFYPENSARNQQTTDLVERHLKAQAIPVILWRDVPVDMTAVNAAAARAQLPIKQLVFGRPENMQDASHDDFELLIQRTLLAIEAEAYQNTDLKGFYPCSMSSRMQVYKGRLNSFEVIPYFSDLSDPDHEIATLFFHTRFSTNTAPATMMAQPFRYMAHNGELNTDKKNRLSEDAIARQKNRQIIFPNGQSDSGRLDQTLTRRINEDRLDIVTAVVAMMPPAWENDRTLSPKVRAMLEYFSLYEEKNDGPAALVFSDGIRVGARLDRLGLRPLRSVETHEYLAVTSEAGQIDFPPTDVIKRGRIEAGGILYFDHSTGKAYDTDEVLEMLANSEDYETLLEASRINLKEQMPVALSELDDSHPLTIDQRHTAYSLNQESFKFLLDSMILSGMEKVSAMGYGLAPNALTRDEGGMSKYFSQRFAQVTNPPLDSLRERDGMTLRVALGPKPNFSSGITRQIAIESPILQRTQLQQIRNQTSVETVTIDALFTPNYSDAASNEKNLEQAVEAVCDQVEKAARDNVGIIILADTAIDENHAAIPLILMISAANQRLIRKGLRFNSSLIAESGQIASSHDVATALGFGASGVCPISVHNRVLSHPPSEGVQQGLDNFQVSVEKSLMKTMGKFGLCTAESYIGGEFFESNYLDTLDPRLAPYFPHINAPVGGAGFADIAASAADWHQRALKVEGEKDIPFLGLFKERQEGAGHTFGNTAVREYINMTDEDILYVKGDDSAPLDMGTDAVSVADAAYKDMGFEKRSPEQIDRFVITPAYRSFAEHLYQERDKRPAALRDIMAFPADVTNAYDEMGFDLTLGKQNLKGNLNFLVRGLVVSQNSQGDFILSFTEDSTPARLQCLARHFRKRFSEQEFDIEASDDHLLIAAKADACPVLYYYLSHIQTAPAAINLEQVQPAHEITGTLASGAMSHGALLGPVHEAVAQGTNIVGGMSNSGEGGENSNRFNTLRSCKIKQFASGRFGVWAGYLADPNIEEIEIKIAQGAKPGEGGQLPASKVSVEIAALRGGTPRVELVSPPPHHDTYSIEDLGQLIHDCKAARVKVIVKLVSSEGIGTIAVGVAKAGADVINVAGNSGGTGAASVTSLKNTGRSPEIGIAEVHQALSANGLRQKVILRCSAAHQSGADVVKSAILGGDSFEFGTTSLMMLRCVMAKNCNVKCPAGLTTEHEEFKGDARVLAQYYMNLAHEVREILASLGYSSLREIRGRTELLHLIEHESMVGQLNFFSLLAPAEEMVVEQPVYLEADFSVDNLIYSRIRESLFEKGASQVVIEGDEFTLNNRNKTVGGQTSIDLERHLQYLLEEDDSRQYPFIYTNEKGRRYLAPDSVIVRTQNSAGQSYAAFCNDGMRMEHSGTCNDGVGKGACGGVIAVKSPGGGDLQLAGGNVLVGNFALFGATGGMLFVNGEAGDRFGVRNSGAMAVVEGVGDFACEYMTNGTILNLGTLGKGFCNGMSGGNAYQYDPSGMIEGLYDSSSVMVKRVTLDDDAGQAHAEFIRHMLEQHSYYTGSPRAEYLLENWDTELQNFFYAEPLWLYKTQVAEHLLGSIPRKSMLEELSVAMANRQISLIQKGYEQDQAVLGGAIPAYGSVDTAISFRLINSFTVINKASAMAEEQLKKRLGSNYNEDVLAQTTKQLIMTHSRKLVDTLAKNAREALSHYDDEQLAVLLADKRLNDYKTALEKRDVQAVNSLGTTAWIIRQDRLNQARIREMTDFDELLAIQCSHEIVQSMLTSAAA